jgi:hypothetical protein
MKIIRFFLFVLVTIFLASQAEAADWIYMGTDELIGIQWSYDVETLTESSAGIMKVWILSEYSDEGRKRELQWRMNEGLDVKGYDTLSQDFSLCEVNCATREYRLMEISFYSADGKVIYSHNYRRQVSEGWRRVPPETMADKLYEAVCPPQEKK